MALGESMAQHRTGAGYECEGSSPLAEAEERWVALVEGSDRPIMVVSLPDTVLRMANPVARTVYALADDLAGARLTDLFSREVATSVRAWPATGGSHVVEVPAAQPGERGRAADLVLTPIRWHGEPGALVEVRDGTDRRTAARSAEGLRRVEQQFRQAFDEAAIGMALVSVGPDPGRFLEANQAMCDLVGRTADDLRARTFTEISLPEDAEIGLGVFRSVLGGEQARGVVEKRYVHSDGHPVWARVTVSAIRGVDGEPVHFVAQAEDITTRKLAEEELLHSATHDSLTGLPNRRQVMEHLERALARATRRASVVGVLYVDIDDFKDVNDSLGHAAGDEVLMELAARIQGALRGGDVAARLGGDELVIVCEDLAGPGEIEPMARRIVDLVTEPLHVADHVLHLSASVGVATGGIGSTATRLIRDADAAMYRAKKAGKAHFEVGDHTLAALAMRQIEVYDDLHRAVQDDELRLHYQPVIDLATGRVVAVEALLRWQHPERGLLPPGEFIDVAESRQLIVPIGAWVVQEAIRQAAAWVAELGADAPRMWVNVSGRQVGKRDFSGVVRSALAASGLSPDLLGVELTERQAVRAARSVRADLTALRALGVGLAIDDFGTGRAGIEYLRELPVSTLKIDQTFIAGLGTERTDTALTSALITMGHELGLSVTAEGVETEAQLAMLRSWGCDQVQGYLLGRPQDASSLTSVLLDGA